MNGGRKMVAAMAVAAVSVGLVACSDSSSPSESQFIDNVDNVCRTLGNDLADLTKPATPADVAGFADDASAAYTDAVAALKKLAVPGDSAAVADATRLVMALDSQIDMLDDIAKAAKQGDQATVDAKTAEFEAQSATNADVADSLGAGRCAIDPLFDELAPPVTDPPVTDPVTTPVTTPITTAPQTNKTIISLVDQITPANGLTFVEVDDSLLGTWISVLDAAPSTLVAAGQVAAVEVSASGNTFARVFVYLPDTPLDISALDDVAQIVAEGASLSNATYNGFPGYAYTSADGKQFFIGSNSASAAGFIVWAVSGDTAGLDAAISGLWASLPE